KQFFDILRMIPKNITKRYVSNGILMDKEAAEKLIEYELHNLYISIDAASEETFLFVRGQKGFERIVNNIKTLMQLKKERNAEFPNVTMCYTFFRRNAEEFMDFLDLAHSLGVKKVSGDYLIVYRQDLIKESLYFDQPFANDIWRRAKEKATKLGIQLTVPKSFEEAARQEKSGKMIMC